MIFQQSLQRSQHSSRLQFVAAALAVALLSIVTTDSQAASLGANQNVNGGADIIFTDTTPTNFSQNPNGVYDWGDQNGDGVRDDALSPPNLSLGVFQIRTDNGDDLILNLNGGDITGTSSATPGLSTEFNSGDSGDIIIRNVGDIASSGFFTGDININSRTSGDILIGESDSLAGTVRIDFLITASQSGDSRQTGDITIYSNSDVLIEDSSAVLGTISTEYGRPFSFTTPPGAVTVQHEGTFRADTINTSASGDNNSRTGDVTLNGDIFGNGASGNLDITTIDAANTATTTFSQANNDVTISGYLDVTVGTLQTFSRNVGNTGSRPSVAGNVTIIDIEGDVDITTLQTYARDTDADGLEFTAGTIVISTDGSITLGDLTDTGGQTFVTKANDTATLTAGQGITIATFDTDLSNGITVSSGNGLTTVTGDLLNFDTGSPTADQLDAATGQVIVYDNSLGGNAYLGGVEYTLNSGGILTTTSGTQDWDGGIGNWDDSNWGGGGAQSNSFTVATTITNGTVEVTDGPGNDTASVALSGTGTLNVQTGGTLDVRQGITAATGSTLDIDGGGTLNAGLEVSLDSGSTFLLDGTLTANTLTVAGTNTVGAGASLNVSTLNVNSALDLTGATLTLTGSDININDTSLVIDNDVTNIDNLTMTGAATFTSTGSDDDITVLNTATLSDTSALDTADFDVVDFSAATVRLEDTSVLTTNEATTFTNLELVGGTLTRAGGAAADRSVTIAGGTLLLDDSSAHTFAAGEILTASAAGTTVDIQTGSSLTVNDNTTIANLELNGGTFALGGTSTLTVSESLVLRDSSTATFNATNTLDATGALVDIGIGTTLSVAEDLTADTLTIDGTFTRTGAAGDGDVTVTGELNLNTGTLDVSGGDVLTTAGAVVNVSGGNLATDTALSADSLNLIGGSFTRSGVGAARDITIAPGGTLALIGIDLDTSGGETLTTTGATVDIRSGRTLTTAASALSLGTLIVDGGTLAGATSVVATAGYQLKDTTITADLSGTGGLEVTAGNTLVTLTGTNTYTGITTIDDGVLSATDGASLSNSSGLRFQGGVLESSGTFTRDIDSTPVSNQVDWGTGGGGFAAVGGDLTVTLEGGATLDWGSSSTGFSSQRLIFGSVDADSAVILTNDITSSGSERIVEVIDNPFSDNDEVVFSGANVSFGALLTKVGDGRMVIAEGTSATAATTNAENSDIEAGELRVNGTFTVDRIGASTRDLHIASGATLSGTGTIISDVDSTNRDSVDILSGGTVAPGESVGTLSIIGDYNQSGGSTYQWEMDRETFVGPFIFDLVDIDGNLDLDDTWTLEIIDINGYVGNDTELLDLFRFTGVLDDGGTSGVSIGTPASPTVLGSAVFDTSDLNLSLWTIGTLEIVAYTEGGFNFVALRGLSGGTQVVPEPSTYAMFAMGLFGVGLLVRRRRKKVATTAA